MDVDMKRGLHSDFNNRILSSNIQTEQKNKQMPGEELSVANPNAYEKLHSICNAKHLQDSGIVKDYKYKNFQDNEEKNWPSKICGDGVSIVNCGNGEKCTEKYPKKHTDEDRKFERDCDEKYPMETGYTIKESSDKIPPKHTKHDKTFERTSVDEFPKEIAGNLNEFSDKTYERHTEHSKKFETTNGDELSKETDETRNEHNEKLSKKHTSNERQFGRNCQNEYPKQSGSAVQEFRDQTPEKEIVNNKKFERTSCEELSKETGVIISKPNQKLFKKQTYDERKFEMTFNKDFPKEIDRIEIQLSEKYLEKYTDGKWKPQEIYIEESSKVNGATKIERTVEPSKPELISTDESPEKKADIFDVFGSDGLWQRFMFSWKFCLAIPTAFHYMAMTFLAPDIDYWCAKPADVNWTINEWKIHGLAEDKHCYRYSNITKEFATENITLAASDVVTCDAWEYDRSFYTSTVVSQWDLVCGQEWLASFSLSMFNIGTLISNLVIGHLADILGRKPIIVGCLTIVVSSAIVCAFSLSYTMFVLTRFLTAFGLCGVFNVSYVLLLEITGPKERSFYGVAMHFGWCIGFISLPGVAWLLRDWIWIEIAITVPCVLLLLTCWILPESPRWLMMKGKMKEAEKILIKAAKINGRKISNLDSKLRTVMDSAQKAYKPSETSKGFIDLVCSPGLWRNTLNIWLLWFVNSFTYYGLSYSTNALAGDPFVNFALSGVVEIPGCIITTFAIHFLGRKKPLAFTMIFGGIACLLMYALPEDPWWLSTAVSMIGKCSVTIAVTISYICTAEIFPTVVRNAGLGSASFFSRLGAVLAPFVKELGNATHPVVPQIVFGALGCFSGALVFLLPETKDLNMSETLENATTRKNPTQNEDIENFQPGS